MVCTAVWPFLLHMYMCVVLLFFGYGRSPSALLQAFIQSVICQESFVVYMSAAVLLKITVEFTCGSHRLFWELRGRARIWSCPRL